MSLIHSQCIVCKLKDVKESSIIYAWAVNKDISDIFCSYNGLILLHDDQKKIKLRYGMRTLQRKLGLRNEPVFCPYMGVEQYFLKLYPNGQISNLKDKIWMMYSQNFTLESIKTMITNTSVKKLNTEILRHSTSELLEKGKLSIYDMRKTDDAKAYFFTRQIKNPDLGVEGFTAIFQHHELINGVYIPTKRFGETRVEIESHTLAVNPDALRYKLKHYYIYSKTPGFGKSLFLDEMESKYNARVVTDFDNFMNIAPETHLFLLDEYSPNHAIPLPTLKSVTGGNAAHVSFRIKSYGNSFVCRKDSQFIIVSNFSPYQVHGERKSDRCMMSKETMEMLEQRFHIIRLDGRVQEDRMLFGDPSVWNRQEYITMIGKLFSDKLEPCGCKISIGHLIEAIYYCYTTCYKVRAGTAIPVRDIFIEDMKEACESHGFNVKIIEKYINLALTLKCTKKPSLFNKLWHDDTLLEHFYQCTTLDIDQLRAFHA